MKNAEYSSEEGFAGQLSWRPDDTKDPTAIKMISSNINWPLLPSSDDAYNDEFGEIDADVYAAAGDLWPRAAGFARDQLGDESAGQRLLFKAAADVSRQKLSQTEPIRNLNAYLLKSFKRLVLAEVNRRRRDHGADGELEELPGPAGDEVDDAILLDEILRRMKPDARRLFNLRTLGYSYEEIAQLLGSRANLLRSQLDKEIKRIRKLLNQPAED